MIVFANKLVINIKGSHRNTDHEHVSHGCTFDLLLSKSEKMKKVNRGILDFQK